MGLDWSIEANTNKKHEILQNAVHVASSKQLSEILYTADYDWRTPIFILTHQNEFLIVSSDYSDKNYKIHILPSSSPNAVNQRIHSYRYCNIPDLGEIKKGQWCSNLPTYKLAPSKRLFRYISQKSHLSHSLAHLLPNISKDYVREFPSDDDDD